MRVLVCILIGLSRESLLVVSCLEIFFWDHWSEEFLIFFLKI